MWQAGWREQLAAAAARRAEAEKQLADSSTANQEAQDAAQAARDKVRLLTCDGEQ